MADETLVDDRTTDTTSTTGTVVADTTTDTGTTTDTTTDTTTTVTDTVDWRSSMAGEDEKLLAYLGKFQSPNAFLADAKKKNDLLLQRKSAKLPENPTPEELSAYRKDNGIPDAPEGYLEGLPNGIVVGDDDRPNVDKFLTKMHGVNADKPTVAAALDAYYGMVAEQTADQAELDRANDQECVDVLREEWGADFRRNSNVLKAFLDAMPKEVSDALARGRGPDGRVLSMNPVIMKWLTGKALEENPLATVVPGAGANQIDAINEELAALKTKMGDRGSDYWKGPNAAKNQERYRVLVEAQTKAQKQG